MSATPKKGNVNRNVPRKHPVRKHPVRKAVPLKKPPVKKPVSSKEGKPKEEKKQGGGLFASLFNLFKKKPKEIDPLVKDAASETPIMEAEYLVTDNINEAEELPTASVYDEPTEEEIEHEEELDVSAEEPVVEIESSYEEPVAEEEKVEPPVAAAEEIPPIVNEELPPVAEPVKEPIEEKPVQETIKETPPPVMEEKKVSPELVFPDEAPAPQNPMEDEQIPAEPESSSIESNDQVEEENISEEEELPKFTSTSTSSAFVEEPPLEETTTDYNESFPTSMTTENQEVETSTPSFANSDQVNETLPPKEEKKKRRFILIPFLILSLLGNVILTWLLINEKHTVKTVRIEREIVLVEKNNVISDLLKLKEEYASLQTNNVGLQKELEEKRAEIDKLIDQAKKHKNDTYIIANLRKETESLRKIMRHFVHEIDSLNTLNKTIIAEKDKISGDLNSQITITNELEKDKSALIQTVNKGSVLKAITPTATGIRYRGGAKESETNKASRVEKIKVSFTLGQNPIAKKGTKTVYIHIMGPNGKEVTLSESEQNSIKIGGSRGFFAEKKEVDYENEDVLLSVYCPNSASFIPGKYLIDVVCEGAIIGQTDITLK